MEEMVWLYFSILAVLIAFAAIGSLVYNNSAKMQQEHLVTSLDELKAQCDFACASAQETRLPITVTLPSGLYLYTRAERICGKFGDDSYCRVCNCRLNPFEMSLNTTFAKRVFKSHDYLCYFERLEDGVEMDCQG